MFETHVLFSEYVKAYEIIVFSVVRVVSYVKKSRLKEEQFGKKKHVGVVFKPLGSAPGSDPALVDDDEIEAGVGIGVVIVDKGVILTNLHVVSGADRIKVVFSDGLEATASVTGAQPENDLAVLQAYKILDDLILVIMCFMHDL